MRKNLYKKIGILCIIFCLICLTLGTLTACGGIEYPVTILNFDESPAEGVTVSFMKDDKEETSAKTNAEGKATLKAAADKYTVKLSTLPNGAVYNQTFETDRLGTAFTITLEKGDSIFSVTIKMPDGTAVANATVRFMSGSSVAGTATTDANGVASATLAAGNYTLSLSSLPNGYYYAGDATITPATATKELTLSEDRRVAYPVTVETEGGLLYPDINVAAYLDGALVASEITDETGSATFRLDPAQYTITAQIPRGYVAEHDSYTTDTQGTEIKIRLFSEIMKENMPENTRYTVGSILYDFTMKTFDGAKTVTLSELLETKAAVVLNFWYTTCSWCLQEFPVMQQAYEQYSDKIEIVALDPYTEDNDTKIAAFRASNSLENLTFPMGMDMSGVGRAFGLTNFPTTVVVDRYGAAAFVHAGADLQESSWINLFSVYAAPDYKQSFVPGTLESEAPVLEREHPTVEMPASSELEAAVNNTQSGFNFSFRPETATSDAEYSWPWTVSQKDGKDVIVPANSSHHNSFATVHTDVTLKAGQGIAFDFLCSTEKGADALYVSVDSLVQFQASGDSNGWSTCYAYVALKAGTYDLSLLYNKDTTMHGGDDIVYVTNFRLINESDIDKQTDVMRTAATEPNASGSFDSYITPVFNEEEGFYRVGSKDGPYLLADLAHPTLWSSVPLAATLYSEDVDDSYFIYEIDGVYMNCYNALVEYYALSVYSDYYGMIPVNEQLYILMTNLMNKIAQANEHRNLKENEWLEVCKYVTRYASDEPIPNPIAGLAPETSYRATVGENAFYLTKAIYPISGLLYAFTPDEDGVYYFHSAAENGVETQIWIFDEKGIEDGLLGYCGDDMFKRLGTEDIDNFQLYIYLEKDVTYFLKVAFYWAGATGSFNFTIEKMGATYTVLETCTAGYYTSDFDEDNNPIGNLRPAGAIEYLYDEDEDAYYHKKKDGSRGSKIYVDVKGFSRANPFMTLEKIVDSHYYYDVEKDTLYKPFDFRFDPVYDDNGNVSGVTPAKGEDYTAEISEILATADENGLVAATKRLVEILSCYAERELFGCEDDWLRFCVYYHTYGAD